MITRKEFLMANSLIDIRKINEEFDSYIPRLRSIIEEAYLIEHKNMDQEEYLEMRFGPGISISIEELRDHFEMIRKVVSFINPGSSNGRHGLDEIGPVEFSALGDLEEIDENILLQAMDEMGYYISTLGMPI